MLPLNRFFLLLYTNFLFFTVLKEHTFVYNKYESMFLVLLGHILFFKTKNCKDYFIQFHPTLQESQNCFLEGEGT
ncbi:hypothetical protein ACA29_11935 [Lederbergia galactosidilytica]|uniref:Uncharacterized protein n=1 Tax=Lederbergia galactosidilytica TaxID=217031 RepID=A0A0Q9Y7T6_9BACI|nr:hypothetical protein ACA29_11935 [Lederbergia galactosidilytica]